MTQERYQVSTDKIIHSCCHEAVVVDTKQVGEYLWHVIAECPTVEDATKIAKALNALGETK